MLYILTALFYEAKPYIDIFHLKRVASPGGIQLFEGDNCLLAIGGTGPVNASAAAAYMLTRYAPTRTDMLANIGMAGSAVFNIGEIVLCHKIINAFTGRELYPDMLCKHPFHEGALYSVGQPVRESPYELSDMEGAFAFEASQIFLPSSQIQCIKIISDNLHPESVTAAELDKLMYETAEPIRDWLVSLAEQDKPAVFFTEEENRLMGIVSEHFKFTYAMNQRLQHECKQAKIRCMDINSALTEALEIKCTGKNEGKAALAKLISRLTEGV